MATYILILHSPPWSHQSTNSAVDFATAALESGHEIKAIFLYQDSVLTALPLLDIPSDELNGQDLLVTFQKEFDVPLLLCATAAEKRGVNEQNISNGFQLAGLAELAAITAETDKIVQFK